jgi:sterol desaturase/sphingolipid hydroxylase (fatty acid hydroxylase superfamily)
MSPNVKPHGHSIDYTGRCRRNMRHVIRIVTMSRTNYWASYVIDFTCPLVFGYLGWRAATGGVVAPVSLALGALAFSFVEYAIHRWLFHSPTCFMSALHQSHHDAPTEPSALPCIASALVAFVLWSAVAPVVGRQVAGFFLCGFLGGYSWYVLLHHVEHHTAINHLPYRWLQRRWATHSLHHRWAHTNFGVTTDFWDRVCGTRHRPRLRSARMEKLD